MMDDSPGEHVCAEAERWFLRVREPDCTDAERRVFERWLSAAEPHRVAYQRAERLWGLLGEAVQSPEVRALSEAVLPPFRDRKARPAWISWAAVAAAFLALGVGYQVYRSFRPHVAEHFRTGVGETRSVGLADGSAVTLDTDSHLAVRYSRRERRLELARGAAFLDVRPDAGRPFTVTTELGRATVLGTRFQVRVGRDRLAVLLVDGSLRLDQPAHNRLPETASVILRRREQATLTRGERAWQTSEADVEALTAWRQRRLIFRDTPLPEAVAEVNRYHPAQLHIGEASLESLTVNGVFHTDDLDSFVLALEHTLPVRVLNTSQGGRVLVGVGTRRR